MNVKPENSRGISEQLPGSKDVSGINGLAGLAGHDAKTEAGVSDASQQRRTNGAAKPQRAMAKLGRGRSVIVVGRDLTLESWIKTVQEALAKARRAETYGLQLESFLKMLRDMSGG